MKCAHCQDVHNDRKECPEIKALKHFCGDTEYQAKLLLKRKRKNEKAKY